MYFRRRFVVKLFNAMQSTAAALVLVAVVAGAAQAATCTVNGSVISSGKFPPADPTTPSDVTITGGKCTASYDAAGKGIFKYRNVNIYDGGELAFIDNGNPIHFYALSMLIENKGSLTAGTAAKRFGSLGGTLTIHLWGKQQVDADNPVISCKTGDHCGVPDGIWNSNSLSAFNPGSCTRSTQAKNDAQLLPGGVDDCFYSYLKIDNSDPDNAYFGHKVLALSYGGGLQLFGQKGATFDTTISASNSGKSWLRLKGSMQPGDQTLTVDGDVGGGVSAPGAWQDGDHIVVTTTDFLPEHSEELIIKGTPKTSGGTTKIDFEAANPDPTHPDNKGVRYPHNGEQYDLKSIPNRVNIGRKSAETRAAVALLSRSIRIVSDGDTAGSDFTETAGNYYGGDTIVRQGFASFEVQGVEFFQLGKGGMIMHYPVHFHMARMTPQPANPQVTGPITYLKDCSIRDSMTRWVTIHGTQGVTLARNVGYKSIGHGFYLEDGTETDNKLYSNIGILARAAVAYSGNPRKVPGILTAKPVDPPDNPNGQGFDKPPYFSDSNHPSVFWIMNGWNDFEYNMAAGAGTCGACYWFVPGQISGPSQKEHWFGYAGEQTPGRDSISPLQEFVGNSCTSAMNGFTVNSSTAACNGVNILTTDPNNNLTMLPSDGANSNYPPKPNDTYWPILGGGGRFATRCPAADNFKAGDPYPECGAVQSCANGKQDNCDVTVLDQFTTSFNWTAENFAAVWLRPQWALVLNSTITDPLNAGLNFITGGSYTRADVITGYWGLSLKNVFIGTTQKDNPYASNAGPFNPFTHKVNEKITVSGLKCAVPSFGSYCLNKDEGLAFQRENFAVNQRLYSIYDGPSYQDSDAFLNVQPTYLTKDGTAKGEAVCTPSPLDKSACANSGFTFGPVLGVRRDPLTNKCYMPNAAIAWKQPNGFYYPPAFHSTNLFFGDKNGPGDNAIDIRHFVIEPLFGSGPIPCSFVKAANSVPGFACYDHPKHCTATMEKPDGQCTCMTDGDCSTIPGSAIKDNKCDNGICVYGSFTTDLAASEQDYCNRNDTMFTGFTDIDRETVLNDDDGTLTGLTSQINNPPTKRSETISVNNENFFNAPVQTSECASDIPANPSHDSKKPPATAKTSPYEWVTAAIYPECALSVPDSSADLRVCSAPNKWGSACSTSDARQVNTCSGILLYRQFLTEEELANKPPPLEQAKRMMGQNLFQRSGLTVNHGSYYIDTTVSADAAAKADYTKSFNEFVGGQKYEVLFVYAKANTKQKYTLYVGKDLTTKDFDPDKMVLYGHADITSGKFTFTPKMDMMNDVWPTGWTRKYDDKNGWLTISFDMGAPEVKGDFDLAKPDNNPLGKQLCQPSTMCTWGMNDNTKRWTAYAASRTKTTTCTMPATKP